MFVIKKVLTIDIYYCKQKKNLLDKVKFIAMKSYCKTIVAHYYNKLYHNLLFQQMLVATNNFLYFKNKFIVITHDNNRFCCSKIVEEHKLILNECLHNSTIYEIEIFLISFKFYSNYKK